MADRSSKVAKEDKRSLAYAGERDQKSYSNEEGYESVDYRAEKIFQDYLEGDDTAKGRFLEAVKREVEG